MISTLVSGLNTPTGIAVDGVGNVYVAEQMGQRILKVNPLGVVTVIAGTGSIGFAGDGGLATAAKLNFPTDVALGPGGDIYFTDKNNRRVRMIRGGNISTVAGNGTAGSGGDGGSATAASLDQPAGITAALDGTIYLSDRSAHRVRRFTVGGHQHLRRKRALRLLRRWRTRNERQAGEPVQPRDRRDRPDHR